MTFHDLANIIIKLNQIELPLKEYVYLTKSICTMGMIKINSFKAHFVLFLKLLKVVLKGSLEAL